MKGKSLFYASLAPAIFSIITVNQAHSAAYEAGKFSFKPLNANIGAYTNTFYKKDSRFRGMAFEETFTTLEPFDRQVGIYRSPSNWGFAESDRNGTGYAIEAGYVVGMDIEVFGRAGISIERPLKNFSLMGDQLYTIHKRRNFGLALGLRKYFDFDSPWKPFVSAAAGVVSQGKTTADLRVQNPDVFIFNQPNNNPSIRYTLLKKQNLLSLELAAGTDYVFTPNIAMTMSVALRYNERGGSNTIRTPAGQGTSQGNPVNFAPVNVVYSDNKAKWNVPLVVSFKIIL